MQQLIEDGVVAGGMIPKVTCCLSAIKDGVQATHIIDGRRPHALLEERNERVAGGPTVSGTDGVGWFDHSIGYGAGKLMEELQKVKRSWSDEREELRAEAEALKRQALKLQTQQVALPSPRMQFSGQSAAPVAFAAPNERLRVATLGQRRRAEALPLITLQEFRGTLRCLDAGGASLFLVEPEERYARDAVGSPSAAGPLPEGPAPEKCAQCQRPLAIDSNFCGSCGTNQKGSKKEDERTGDVAKQRC
eukprot:g31984.t1